MNYVGASISAEQRKADGTSARFFQLIEQIIRHATAGRLVHFQEMSSHGRQPTVAEIRLNNVVGYLTVAVSTLGDFSDLFSTPFLKAISNTTVSLLELAQVGTHVQFYS